MSPVTVTYEKKLNRPANMVITSRKSEWTVVKVTRFDRKSCLLLVCFLIVGMSLCLCYSAVGIVEKLVHIRASQMQSEGFERQSSRPRTRSHGPVRRTAQEIELEEYNLDRSGFRLPYDGPKLTRPLQGEWGYKELPRHKLYYWTPSEWPSKPDFLSDDEYRRLKEGWKHPNVMIPYCTVDDAVIEAIDIKVDYMARAMLNGWNTP
ncbi:uncharacterized protein LOC112348415 [Selaginella moellendorffii]|uniref:uncharacterized protein LOC112348415 n=1 Tax=Selaginella moellendorffii TaxID=88036 RepID=UPI000D1C9223|nr:uncharacterized protein LOC112348415 [Selaginella moellendorffii]|eukprot:XP_024536588.1 uncharacterized protein LOC112348415 [Selaginella moellendorffii]